MVKIAGEIDKTTKTFTAILVLGLVALLFLIVFGNLSGNLGFSNTSLNTVNETGHFLNATTDTLDTASRSDFVSLTVTTVNNASNGVVIASGNFTVSSTLGTIVGSAGRTENFSSVNITYDTTILSTGEVNTNGVINNLTAGANTFFTFSNVWFTLLAIVLLIIIVMSVIAVVQTKNGQFAT